MYTEEMSKAFKAIKAPKNFGVTLYENPDFITIEIDPHQLVALSGKEKEKAVDYINNVKRTLESFGAVILVVRREIDGNNN
jgi:hypothetical protein